MARSDELIGLFNNSEASRFLRKGIVVSWSGSANQINIGGTVFSDLNYLSSVGSLATDDPVAVLVQGSSYLVIGKIVVP